MGLGPARSRHSALADCAREKRAQTAGWAAFGLTKPSLGKQTRQW
jgi:hypothetical protein